LEVVGRLQAAHKEHMGAVSDLLLPPGRSCSSSCRGADVEARTKLSGETPLTCAAHFGTEDIAQLLLEAGANPNSPRLADGVRPLDLAAAGLKPQVACLLLEHGAEVCMSGLLARWLVPGRVSLPIMYCIVL
jgi:ankyrin repeat protein